MTIQEWIRILAVVFGLAAIAAPVVSVSLLSRRPRGLASGKGAGIRTWPVVLLMTAGFIALGIVLWQPVFPGLSPGLDLAFSLAGALFYFPGVGIYLWGLATLREQFGVSSAYGAGLYKEHQLVMDGPFALVRHPMYAGVLLAAVGALLVFKTWAMVLFTPMSFTVIARAVREEKLLAQEFGAAWKAYTAHVPGWFPRIK
jgi:protein-S-isoprenylcysteine O-methyltransferase Ste14